MIGANFTHDRGECEKSMPRSWEVGGLVLCSDNTKTVAGVIEESADGSIEVDRVPIVTPNGDVVVREMNIKVAFKESSRNFFFIFSLTEEPIC